MKLTNKEAADVIMRIQIQLGRRNGKMLLSSALLKAVEVLREAPEWILLSDSVPAEKGLYLTTTIYHEVYCDYWSGEHFDRTEAVIAWQPLPKPYKKEGEEE